MRNDDFKKKTTVGTYAFKRFGTNTIINVFSYSDGDLVIYVIIRLKMISKKLLIFKK